MLVHICCSVDSHYFLTKLRANYPSEKIVGYFYNPNIHPKQEYDLRLLDVQNSCNQLDIGLVCGEYDDNNWFDLVKGLENEPEKGARCEVCFEMRFVQTAKVAKELGIKTFTSTLLQSPLKNQQSVLNAANSAGAKFGVEFLFVDYRSNGGMNEQNSAAKTAGLYRQNFCGCQFGLLAQRNKQNKLPYELISDINSVKLPASAPKRIDTFNQKAITATTQILNYKTIRAYIKSSGKVIPSAVLAYSKSSKENWSDTPFYESQDALFFDKQSAKIITLDLYNKLANTTFTNTTMLNNTSFLSDTVVKAKLLGIDAIDFSPVFVIDEKLPQGIVEFYLASDIYEEKEYAKILHIRSV